MQIVDLREPVKVRADFQGGTITPLAFRRGLRTHRIARVNARWIDREGRDQRLYFSITDDAGDIYQLCLRAVDMLWILESVVVQG